MAQDPGIGKKITGAAQRDAIHVAVLPATAGEVLPAGERVVLRDGVAFEANRDSSDPYVGIVDPFLETVVDKGERFWLFVLPGTVQGLRHDWTHPLIDGTHFATGDGALHRSTPPPSADDLDDGPCCI